MGKIKEAHERSIKWWQNRLGLSDYALAWVSFLKGLGIGFVLAFFWLR